MAHGRRPRKCAAKRRQGRTLDADRAAASVKVCRTPARRACEVRFRQASEYQSLSRYLRQPIAMTAWTRLEYAGDNLSARAMLASGRVVARSDEPLKLWWLRGRAAIAMPASRPESLRIADIVRRSSAPCGRLFWHVTERLSLTAGNLAAPSRTRRHTRLKCLRVRSSHLPWNTAMSSPLCGWGRASRDRPPELLRGQEK